jgi:hypothetical protein
MSPTRPSPEEQERLYRAIADAVWKSVPEDWEEIVLRMEATGDASSPVSLTISGPSGVPNVRVPDGSLYEPTLELYDLYAREARPFARCDFSLEWDGEQESWQFKADYDYPPDA